MPQSLNPDYKTSHQRINLIVHATPPKAVTIQATSIRTSCDNGLEANATKFDTTGLAVRSESKMKAIAVGIACVIGLAACANPSIVRVKSDKISASAITVIFVPRFEGNPNYVEESTDLFVSSLESRVSARVIQGSALRSESADVFAGGNLAPTDLAISKAKESGAQVVVLGKVTSSSSSGGGMLNGFSTVRIIKVADGSVLASFHRPSGLLVGNSEHHAVMKAVERTAEDVSRALR